MWGVFSHDPSVVKWGEPGDWRHVVPSREQGRLEAQPLAPVGKMSAPPRPCLPDLRPQGSGRKELTEPCGYL